MASLDGLNDYVRQQAVKLLTNANKRIDGGKHKVVITQGYRSIAEQDALYAQGRTDKSKPIVTKAKGGTSMHNFGLAIDFALITLDGKKASWDTKADFDKDGKADWMEVVSEAKKLGFEWGGDWNSFTDMPHFQILGGLDEKDIIAGKKPKFPSLDGETKPEVKLADVKKVAPKKKYTSLVDCLKAHNLDSSFDNRKAIARMIGIKNYSGTAEQNQKMLDYYQD